MMMRNVQLILACAAALAGAARAGEAMNVWIAPDTCKVNPINGNVLEEHYFNEDPSAATPGYLRGRAGGHKSLPYYVGDSYDGPTTGKIRRKSPVWGAGTKTITLRAARNEFPAFQVIIENTGEKPLTGVNVTVTDLAGPATLASAKSVRMFRQLYMPLARDYKDAWSMTGPVGRKFWFPEVLVPMDLPGQSRLTVPDPAGKVPRQRAQGVWVDVYVPHGLQPGTYTGAVKVAADAARPVELKLVLEVLPLTLPDELTFTIDMMSTCRPINDAWGLFPRQKADYAKYLQLEPKFFRIFHAHRCTLNLFPGRPTRRTSNPEDTVLIGFAPPLAGEGRDLHVADWTDYDAHFGKYYTGEAFKDLPRAGVPVRHQFLPLSLGWPATFSLYYSDRDLYAAQFKKVLAEFAAHFQAKGWTKTEFQFFLNGKRKFGEAWDTDEPTRKDDYAALRQWGQWFRDALGPRGKRRADFVYRVDIGTPQRMVGELDEVCDLRNINYEAYPQYGFFWSDFRARQQAKGERWWCYAANRAQQRWARNDWSMASSFLWAWAMWDLNTPVNCKWASLLWNPKDPIDSPGVQWSYCAYAYPGKSFGYDGPVPGLKLKATRRGLEDMEYLALLAKKDGNRRRADAILLKYFAAWDRTARKPKPMGSVRVGPDDPFKLREDVLKAMGMK